MYELQRLKKFKGYSSSGALLSRYNEAQIQSALYAATEMQVIARRDYRSLVMAAKKAMLLHDVQRLPTRGFRFTFYGPVSPLRTTRRYGVNLARIIPRLLTCKEWEMTAPIKIFKSGRDPILRITSEDKYVSSLPETPELDSELERIFAEQWGKDARNGWVLERESEPRFEGQQAFFPDFTFAHQDGRRVLLEIVGHWTPEYLEAKRKTLLQFNKEPLLVAVNQGNAKAFLDTGIMVVPYKTSIKIEMVEKALKNIAGSPPAPNQLLPRTA